MSEEERGPRVVAGVSGSPGSLAALRRAAAEARRRGAELLVVIAWEPPGGDFAHRSALGPLPTAMPGWTRAGGCSPRCTPPSATRGPGSRTRVLSYGAHRGRRWSRPPTGPRTCWWSARVLGPDAPVAVPVRRPVLPRARRLPGAGPAALAPVPRTRLGTPPGPACGCRSTPGN